MATIFDFVRLIFPSAKRRQRFFTHHLNHRNFALRMRLGDLTIDQRIVKPNFGSVRIEIREVDAREASPIDGPKTHGTGFTRSVDLAAL